MDISTKRKRMAAMEIMTNIMIRCPSPLEQEEGEDGAALEYEDRIRDALGGICLQFLFY